VRQGRPKRKAGYKERQTGKRDLSGQWKMLTNNGGPDFTREEAD